MVDWGLGFLGMGISVNGVWACGVEPYGFCGVGARYINIEEELTERYVAFLITHNA